MNNEPSLLDYLKSVLDPRKERIRLTGIETDAAPESPPVFEPEQKPPERVRLYQEPPVGERSVALGPEVAADIEPADQTVSESRQFPWRSLGAVFLALFAQSAFEPPDRLVSMGVTLYVIAIAAAIWAVYSGEYELPEIPRVNYRKDSYFVNRKLVLIAMPAILLAFLVLGGNRFTFFNLVIWVGALLLLSFGLAEMNPRSGRLQDLARKLTPPYTIRLSTWSITFTIGFGLALFFRFYHLNSVPLQMFSDHAEKLQDVQDLLNGETRIFFPRNTGREFVQMYLTAFTARVLGFDLTFMALKMGTALAGIVALPYIYLLGKEIANREVGLIAMVFAGISYWLNVITRVALRFSLSPLFVAPTIFYIVRGLRRGNRNDFIWAGIFLGLGLHGYSPYRFVPFLVVAIVVLFILHAMTDSKRVQGLWHLGVVIAVSFVIFLPLLRFISESEANQNLVLYRSLTRLTSIEAPLPENPLKIFTENMWRSLTMFAWDNGNTWVHSVVLRPALDVVSGALFHLGFFLLILRYARQRRWEDSVLILSIPLLLMPSALSLAFPSENPSLNRSGGAIIPVFIIAAMPLVGLMTSIKRWVSSHWGTFTAWAIAAALISFSALMNYDLVFRQYNDQYNLASWNTTDLGRVIREFADTEGSENTAWVIPFPHWVDTRLVGINAGVYIKDYALGRENLVDTVQIPAPKLFLYNVQDIETEEVLFQLYPDGQSRRFVSEIPGKDFMIFITRGR